MAHPLQPIYVIKLSSCLWAYSDAEQLGVVLILAQTV